ncbi:excalibur calcium-binding domain-containing protein [Mycolicibacterium sp. BiH015]|uniref:excalibur calcium-binding domain-containing protein n=1 Tax=Mycolicibacterium sp. BiH015 TaxID=3018808 RepID=UPI0022DFCB1B|nr:excalibur calcium-binding domain-containing protein [Mycolicibacterium sp. BiH015]MDA2891444.1 excalibur calcium-binding domain-containing protein [Mycolicibacterium sp. BiH015]
MIHRLLPATFLAAAAAPIFAGAAAAQQAPFPNCSAARDAGYANIPSSSPYYGVWLDKDRDGIGCES